jgi:hypothetical protein
MPYHLATAPVFCWSDQLIRKPSSLGRSKARARLAALDKLPRFKLQYENQILLAQLGRNSIAQVFVIISNSAFIGLTTQFLLAAIRGLDVG